MQKARCHLSGLQPLVGGRFQVLFTPCSGVLFTFLTVLVRYRSPGSVYLTGWSWPFIQNSSCSALLGIQPLADSASATQLSRSTAGLSRPLASLCPRLRLSPLPPPGLEPWRFGLLPRSLAAYWGITLFSSCRYWMFRFPVRPHQLVPVSLLMGCPHSGHPRINGCLRLPGVSLAASFLASWSWVSTVRPCFLSFLRQALLT